MGGKEASEDGEARAQKPNRQPNKQQQQQQRDGRKGKRRKKQQRKDQLYLNPVFHSITRTNMYPTKALLFIIGCDQSRKEFRMLALDRRSKDLVVVSDRKVYSEEEIQQKLRELDDKHQGLLERKVSGFGIFGVVRFTSGYYILFITKRRKVAMIGGHVVYRIEDMVMASVHNHGLVGSTITPEEKRYTKMFQNVDTTSNFYFSYTYDLTRPLQSNMYIPSPDEAAGEVPAAPRLLRPNNKYVWNYFLTKPYAGKVDKRWVVNAIHGFIAQSNLNIFGLPIFVTLIARRSRFYAGTRYLKRGTDERGNPANDVETEQIVHDASTLSHRSGKFTSYLQLRGSVPLHWQQEQHSMKAKRPISIARSDPFASLAAMHFERLLHRYGSPVIAFDLVKRREKKPRESLLHEGLQYAIGYLNQFLPRHERIRHIAWDMARCNKREGTVLQHLDKFGAKFVQETGIFHAGPQLWCTRLNPDTAVTSGGCLHYDAPGRSVLGRNQCGVVRVNCVDCLDRTNTAQFMIGLCALRHQLYVLGVLPTVSTASVPFDSLAWRLLCELYEDHGDTIALQYGGSSLVNRIQSYREKQWTTHSKDILTTVARYYSNSFTDADKQMAINLFLGKYRPSPGTTPLWLLENDKLLHRYDVLSPHPPPRPPYNRWHTPVTVAAIERFYRRQRPRQRMLPDAHGTGAQQEEDTDGEGDDDDDEEYENGDEEGRAAVAGAGGTRDGVLARNTSRPSRAELAQLWDSDVAVSTKASASTLAAAGFGQEPDTPSLQDEDGELDVQGEPQQPYQHPFATASGATSSSSRLNIGTSVDDDIFATPPTSPTPDVEDNANQGGRTPGSPCQSQSAHANQQRQQQHPQLQSKSRRTSTGGIPRALSRRSSSSSSSALPAQAGTPKAQPLQVTPTPAQARRSIKTLRTLYLDMRRQTVTLSREKGDRTFRDGHGSDTTTGLERFDGEVRQQLEAWGMERPDGEAYVVAAYLVAARHFAYTGILGVPQVTPPRKRVPTDLGLFDTVYSARELTSFDHEYVRLMTTTAQVEVNAKRAIGPFQSTQSGYSSLAQGSNERRVAAQAVPIPSMDDDDDDEEEEEGEDGEDYVGEEAMMEEEDIGQDHGHVDAGDEEDEAGPHDSDYDTASDVPTTEQQQQQQQQQQQRQRGSRCTRRIASQGQGLQQQQQQQQQQQGVAGALAPGDRVYPVGRVRSSTSTRTHGRKAVRLDPNPHHASNGGGGRRWRQMYAFSKPIAWEDAVLMRRHSRRVVDFSSLLARAHPMLDEANRGNTDATFPLGTNMLSSPLVSTTSSGGARRRQHSSAIHLLGLPKKQHLMPVDTTTTTATATITTPLDASTGGRKQQQQQEREKGALRQPATTATTTADSAAADVDVGGGGGRDGSRAGGVPAALPPSAPTLRAASVTQSLPPQRKREVGRSSVFGLFAISEQEETKAEESAEDAVPGSKKAVLANRKAQLAQAAKGGTSSSSTTAASKPMGAGGVALSSSSSSTKASPLKANAAGGRGGGDGDVPSSSLKRGQSAEGDVGMGGTRTGKAKSRPDVGGGGGGGGGGDGSETAAERKVASRSHLVSSASAQRGQRKGSPPLARGSASTSAVGRGRAGVGGQRSSSVGDGQVNGRTTSTNRTNSTSSRRFTHDLAQANALYTCDPSAVAHRVRAPVSDWAAYREVGRTCSQPRHALNSVGGDGTQAYAAYLQAHHHVRPTIQAEVFLGPRRAGRQR